MNKVITSKDAILEVSKNLILEKGWSSLNMRAVSTAGNISIGSVYNYFSSKSELILATVESIWIDIFHMPDREENSKDFIGCIVNLYNQLKQGTKKYPDVLKLHSLSFLHLDKKEGRKIMSNSWNHIQNNLLVVLKNDNKIRYDAFNDLMTPEKLVNMIFSMIYFSLLQNIYDSSFIVEIVRKLIY